MLSNNFKHFLAGRVNATFMDMVRAKLKHISIYRETRQLFLLQHLSNMKQAGVFSETEVFICSIRENQKGWSLAYLPLGMLVSRQKENS